MPEFIAHPVPIPLPGGKTIEEYIGRVAQGETSLSVARMVAPPGWSEPAQQPEFDEYTLVIEGTLIVESADVVFSVGAGEAIITRAGERIRYRTDEGVNYIAICRPAFSPDTVHRD